MNRDETPASGIMPVQRRRRRRPLFALLLTAALLAVFHTPLLRGVGNFLIVDAPHTERCDALLVRFDVESVRAVAELHAQGRVERVLLLPAEPRTTDRMGLTPSQETEVQRELAARGVPESLIEIIPATGFQLPQQFAAIVEYLKSHPEQRVNVVTPRLLGRYVRHVFNEAIADTKLNEAVAAQIAFASVPPQQFDETRWWTSRFGVQRVFQSYVQWAVAATTDISHHLETAIDWRAFEASVAKGEKP